jgi:uncharacterized membrane protein
MNILEQIVNAIVNIHPWHSMVVHFPIAFTGGALLFLVLARWRRNDSLEQAAFFVITLAALGTVLAGVTGLRDNAVRFEGSAPLAPAKIFLAVTLLILTSSLSVSRWRKREVLWNPATTVLYLAGFAASFALALTLAFMGGVILYGI